jgi:2-phospho-L-lactate/phosphoenolpyruvate guanylyltransferase
MGVFAVIPVKNLQESKQRLSSVFSPNERQQLSIAMLEDVLDAVKSSLIEEIVVSANDPLVRESAEKFGASYFSPSEKGLNAAVDQAVSWCKKDGVDSVLILPADIPLLTSQEINRVLFLAKGDSPLIVLCPSWGWGTNALFEKPPQVVSACFGPESFVEHMRQAYKKCVSVRVFFSTGFSVDIDSERDLSKLFEGQNKTRTRRFLEKVWCESRP